MVVQTNSGGYDTHMGKWRSAESIVGNQSHSKVEKTVSDSGVSSRCHWLGQLPGMWPWASHILFQELSFFLWRRHRSLAQGARSSYMCRHLAPVCAQQSCWWLLFSPSPRPSPRLVTTTLSLSSHIWPQSPLDHPDGPPPGWAGVYLEQPPGRADSAGTGWPQ